MTAPSKLVRFGFSILFLLVATGLVYADETIYVSASMGNTDLEESTDFPIDDDAKAFRLGLGYGFNNDIAVEANYVNLGDFTGNTGLDNIGISGEVEGISLSAIFSLPVTDNWSVNVRGGIMEWESELTTPQFREKRDGNDLFYGLGLQANFSENFALTGEWQRYELEDSQADVLFVGARFSF
ncbi:MAG: porin family protein [Gammaproteobacteria bacterium]